jgi:NADH-quinone oxidoreductase subunit L
VIGALAIAGIPPLAGFFSKDEILHAAAGSGNWVLWAVGLITAGLTAFYMFRAVFLTFHGEFRGGRSEHASGHGDQEHHLHESPPVMTVPLWILAVGAIVSGWVGIPWGDLNVFHHFLEPAVQEAAAHEVALWLEIALVVIAVAVAAAGILLARRIYDSVEALERERALTERFPALHRLLVNKYYVDEIYDRLIVRPLAALSRAFWKWVDALFIDGSISLGAWLAELTGEVGRLSTTGNVRNYALYFFLGVIVLFGWLVL